MINPQTIRPIKASKFCTIFQMNEQRGSFQGVDICNSRKYGDFIFFSILLNESESKIIAYRPDINDLLTQLKKENIYHQIQ